VCLHRVIHCCTLHTADLHQQVEQLVKLMKNYVLRRMKEDVEKGVPPKQVQVEVMMLNLCILSPLYSAMPYCASMWCYFAHIIYS
jgi:SNF2-related domain